MKQLDRDLGIATVAVIAALIIAAALGYYFATITVVSNGSTPSPQGSQNPYVLNLVEIMDAKYNSTVGAQARYYVATSSGLESSANLTIPSHTLIELVITSYDMGNLTPPAQYEKVTGTVGNQITVINGMVASGDNVSQQWEQNYTTVPSGLILHTFTVPQLNLNIPVVAGDTEIAYFYANSTGTFTWMCMTPCGYGADGLSGAMNAPGWMTGSLTVT
ncbi:MAG: hypothetical protein JRN20_22470 [Nitrososphaerota archaeon]|nr:hypothetical protein [Nitrososphaerota archaeon]